MGRERGRTRRRPGRGARGLAGVEGGRKGGEVEPVGRSLSERGTPALSVDGGLERRRVDELDRAAASAALRSVRVLALLNRSPHAGTEVVARRLAVPDEAGEGGNEASATSARKGKVAGGGARALGSLPRAVNNQLTWRWRPRRGHVAARGLPADACCAQLAAGA